MAQRESKLSRDIMNNLRARGIFCFKIHGGPFMMSGLPDIIACVAGRFVAFETKLPGGGNPSPVQKLVHGKIQASGGRVFVVRSVSAALGHAEAILAEVRDQSC